MPWVRFEPTIPVFERAKTFHALGRGATVIGESRGRLQTNSSETRTISARDLEVRTDETAVAESQNGYYTEQVGLEITISGSARFESRLWRQLFDRSFSWFPTVAPGKCRDSTRICSRYLSSKSFPVYHNSDTCHSTIKPHMVYEEDGLWVVRKFTYKPLFNSKSGNENVITVTHGAMHSCIRSAVCSIAN
jgi:hypothetical protein